MIVKEEDGAVPEKKTEVVIEGMVGVVDMVAVVAMVVTEDMVLTVDMVDMVAAMDIASQGRVLVP